LRYFQKLRSMRPTSSTCSGASASQCWSARHPRHGGRLLAIELAQRPQLVLDRMVVIHARRHAVHALRQHKRLDRMQAAAGRAGLLQHRGVRADHAHFLRAKCAVQQARGHLQRHAGLQIEIAAGVALQQLLVQPSAAGGRQLQRAVGRQLHRRWRRFAELIEQGLEAGRLHAVAAADFAPAAEGVRQRRQGAPMHGAQSLVAFAHGGVLRRVADQQAQRQQARDAVGAVALSASARSIHTVWLKAPSAARLRRIDRQFLIKMRRHRHPTGAGRQRAAASQHGTPVDRQFFTGFNVAHGAAADFRWQVGVNKGRPV
jgi:hypothetical protein